MTQENVESSPLWNRVCGRNEIMEIAEDLIEVFKPMFVGNDGSPVRYVSIQTTDFFVEQIRNTYTYHVTAIYLTDQGPFTVNFVVREFERLEHMANEVKTYKSLSNRLRKHKDIQLAEIIGMYEQFKALAYEIPPGEKPHELEVPRPCIYFAMGRVCASIHGKDERKTPVEKTKLLLDYLLDAYPFTDEEKDAIRRLSEKQETRLRKSNSGYVALSAFDPEYIRMQSILPGDQLTNELILLGEGILSYVIHKPTEEIIQERLFEIALAFIDQAFEEFTKQGFSRETISLLIQFIQGYEKTLLQDGGNPLKKLYKGIPPLSYYFAVAALIYNLSFFQDQVMSSQEKRIIAEDVLRFVYYCLVKKEFDKIFAFENDK